MPAKLLNAGAIGRFAVVKLWPEIKTAEDECIARLKYAAQAMGVECIEIFADGRILSSPDIKVTKENVDFVIHLHYDTPKSYDAFSFVALWNPLKFYHEWGYARCSRNLTTHDDFLSCSSGLADDHVARMLRTMNTPLPAKFNLYHSTADVVHQPSLGEGKLFYAGINWEAINGGNSRHQEVLKSLDKTGLLRICGPSVFLNVRVWAGYDSYVKEIPFDGISMIDEISKAGVALVLSSPAHKESELMSNRLFESVAAGALVICDENPFAKKFFGDSLLYIDSRSPVDQIVADIIKHLDWALTHQEKALVMIAKTQDIFREKFTLTRNLVDLYNGLEERKRELVTRQNPPSAPPIKIHLYLLMPEYSKEVLQAHINSVQVQEYKNFNPFIVVDTQTAAKYSREIKAELASSPVTLKVVEMDFFSYGNHPEIVVPRRLGEILLQLLRTVDGADAFMMVTPNEILHSNHLAVLAGSLQRDPDVHCAATAAILIDGDTPVKSVHEVIDFSQCNHSTLPGYGRFIFRTETIPDDIGIALPYLHCCPLAVLVGNNIIAQQVPASITIYGQHIFLKGSWDPAAEREIIHDYSPGALKPISGFSPFPAMESAALTPLTKSQFVRRLFDRRWVVLQVQAIRNQGLRARIGKFKQRLGL